MYSDKLYKMKSSTFQKKHFKTFAQLLNLWAPVHAGEWRLPKRDYTKKNETM
jgi:hypothetical protein